MICMLYRFAQRGRGCNMQYLRNGQLQACYKDSDARWACFALKQETFLIYPHVVRKYQSISCAQSLRLGLLRWIPVNMEWHKLCPLHNDDMHHLLHVHKLCGFLPPLPWESLLCMLSPKQGPHHMRPTRHLKLFAHSQPNYLCQVACKVFTCRHHTPIVGMCTTSAG